MAHFLEKRITLFKVRGLSRKGIAMKKISFPDKSEKERGIPIIFLGGPVVYDVNHTYKVPESSVCLLDEAKVNYEIIDETSQKLKQYNPVPSFK